MNQEIEPLVRSPVTIEFLDVAESACFPSGISQHYVLQVDIALTTSPRYHYTAQKLLVLRKRTGKTEYVEDERAIPDFFDSDTYRRLKERLLQLFQEAAQPSPASDPAG
ncbi:MAG: hypothetical protein NC910_04415 [Candidatus Omnitrophica bacterium]|nr:hypothetical protein [Candidatus Omnitrophota bacterium]